MGHDTRVFHDNQPNLWLGTPRTARDVVPITAGLPIGSVPTDADFTPSGLSRGRLRVIMAKLLVVTSSAAGFVHMLPDRAWSAGQLDAAGTFTDDTTDAQDIEIDDFGLFTTTANDGFVVAASIPFNVLSIDQTTASAGGSPIFDYAYWGRPTTGLASASDAWVVVTPVVSASFTAAADERLVVLPVPFRAPVATTVASPGGGIPPARYAVRVRATTAPSTTGGSAARIYVGRSVYWQTSVTANTTISLNEGGEGGRVFDGGVAFGGFIGTAAANNMLYVEYL